MVVVGADVHKRTHTFVGVDEAARELGHKTFPATTEGHRPRCEGGARCTRQGCRRRGTVESILATVNGPRPPCEEQADLGTSAGAQRDLDGEDHEQEESTNDQEPGAVEAAEVRNL